MLQLTSRTFRGCSNKEARGEGVLVAGSGLMTHGLPCLTPEMLAGRSTPGWTGDFRAWAAEALDRIDGHMWGLSRRSLQVA